MWTEERKQRLIKRGFLHNQFSIQAGIPIALDILPNPRDTDPESRDEIPYLWSYNSDFSDLFPQKAESVMILKPLDITSIGNMFGGIGLLEELAKEERLTFPYNSIEIYMMNHGQDKFCIGEEFLEISTKVGPTTYELSFSISAQNPGRRLFYSATFREPELSTFQLDLKKRHLGY